MASFDFAHTLQGTAAYALQLYKLALNAHDALIDAEGAQGAELRGRMHAYAVIVRHITGISLMVEGNVEKVEKAIRFIK